MPICWYCHWGWAEPVAEIYRRYEAIVGEDAMCYGPAHIVWADENFEDHNIQYCIDNAEEWTRDWNRDLTATQITLVIDSLKELKAIPESVRACEPDDYDGWHPSNYPPKVKTVKI